MCTLCSLCPKCTPPLFLTYYSNLTEYKFHYLSLLIIMLGPWEQGGIWSVWAHLVSLKTSSTMPAYDRCPINICFIIKWRNRSIILQRNLRRALMGLHLLHVPSYSIYWINKCYLFSLITSGWVHVAVKLQAGGQALCPKYLYFFLRALSKCQELTNFI